MIHKSCLLILLMYLSACSEKQRDLPADASLSEAEVSVQQDQIAWFEDGFEAAFVAAERENKAVFLYWGAEWCPPCNQLKATVFKDPDFIEKTRYFIPLYLDGDTERAQLLGERFAIQGYPSLLILDAKQNEITRIPGGIDLDQYVQVLDLVLEKQLPVGDVLQNLEHGSAISERDYQLLSLYSWSQDRGKVLPQDGAAAMLYRLYTSCPEALPVARSRLFVSWWNRLRAEAADNAGEVETKYKAELLAALQKMLADNNLIFKNLDFMLYDRGKLPAVFDEKCGLVV